MEERKGWPCHHSPQRRTETYPRVFGRVVAGMPHIHTIGKLQTDDKDKPISPVVITHCGELELRRPQANKPRSVSPPPRTSRISRERSRSRSRSASPRRKDRAASDDSEDEEERRRRRKERKREKRERRGREMKDKEETLDELDAR
jgi:peptidyl-prolyl isomerase G (cyclophilin G)